LVTKS